MSFIGIVREWYLHKNTDGDHKREVNDEMNNNYVA